MILDAEAQYRLAECYLNGIVTEQDFELAEYWFEKSTKQGKAEAQSRLDDCYLLGIGTEQNYNFDEDRLEELANQGKPEASYWLGYLWEHGFAHYHEDDESSDRTAFEYYKAAVEQFEHTQGESKVKYLALKALADCFEKRKGVWEGTYLKVGDIDNEMDYFKQLDNERDRFKQKTEQYLSKNRSRKSNSTR